MTERKQSPIAARAVDAATLKAFAHPLRMRMYDHLKDHGAATASTLARAMGESTGQTSYHLRQLAKHGLVEEDPDRGTTRERWWIAAGFSFTPDTLGDDAGTRTTLQVVQQHQLQERMRRLQEWLERSADDDPAWVAVASSNEVTLPMTADELEAMSLAIAEVMREHLDRARESRGRDGDEGRRTVKLYQYAFPLPPGEAGPG
ncbi:winged helix-turn-helix domain-containing protein [Serinicoccus kebangsaanensis]|uniref:winged helix-turn-helix domain-containing protein n=1 Tax=Serinicoccus kebangsaanensis TaxID=2602069 RepID=UPI00124CF029|nr:helix-turn-helix domain-containing protein [Serinicoccus kebangsaanensis]